MSFLGLLVFYYDEPNFDLRYKLRSPQPVDPNIVLVNITRDAWDEIVFPYTNQDGGFFTPNQINSDSYFWSTKIWRAFLKNILRDKPKVIFVDLFFDKSTAMTWREERFFIIPEIIWRADSDSRLGFKRPRFTWAAIKSNRRSRSRYFVNIAGDNTLIDSDNVSRRFITGGINKSSIVNAPYKILDTAYPGFIEKNGLGSPSLNYINFRGGTGSYEEISFPEVLTRSFPKEYFKNKIVLIGSDAPSYHFINTPVGRINRTEYFATVIDSLLNNRWIKRLPSWNYFVYLIAISILCFFIISRYPQTISITFLILVSIILTSISIILFDLFNIWIPIISVIATILLSYVILLNQLLSESEYQTWRSQKKEESLLEMNELKNNFVSLFSHDLKTPIAKVQAIAGRLMRHPEMANEVKDEVSKIQKETKELDRYIQSILQVTRIEAGEFNLYTVPADINDLIKNCISTMEPLAKEKGISVEFIEEPLFSIEMDSKLIREVFLNIIDNSIKYCPEGSKISIKTEETENSLIVKFSDNGPGIPKEEQEAVFEKFYRSDKEKKVKKGTGLGLYLVRYFIEIHDGSVKVESTKDSGTTFVITLPLEQNSGKDLDL